jgi:hypothetical protein
MLSNRFILVALIAIVGLIFNVASAAVADSETGLSGDVHPAGALTKKAQPVDLRLVYTGKLYSCPLCYDVTLMTCSSLIFFFSLVTPKKTTSEGKPASFLSCVSKSRVD